MKTVKPLALILLFLFSQRSVSQSYQAGDLFGSLGIGIGIYGGSSNAPDVGGAAAVLIPIETEYALTDKFGVGLTYQYGSYLTDDSVTNSGRTHNIGAMGYFHFAIKERSNLFAKFGIGYTNFGYKEQQANGNDIAVKASGIWVDFGLGWRKMFGERLGMFIYADWSIMPLRNFEDDNGVVWQTGSPPENVKITFQGLDLKAGLIFKII